MPQKNKVKMVSTSTTHMLEGPNVIIETTIPEKGDTTLAISNERVTDSEAAMTEIQRIELTIDQWEEVRAFIAGAIEQLEEAQNEDDGNDD